MDLFVDPDGVVMVRNCGCDKHGFNSLWDSHDEDWKAGHRQEANRVLDERRKQSSIRGGGHVTLAEKNVNAKAVT